MPTFDFQCKKCDHVFEFSRPFGSDENPKCPACGSKRVEKLIASPAVHFKGSGWYKTDSKARSEPKKEAKKEATKGTEGAKEATKDEKVGKVTQGKKESDHAA